MQCNFIAFFIIGIIVPHTAVYIRHCSINSLAIFIQKTCKTIKIMINREEISILIFYKTQTMAKCRESKWHEEDRKDIKTHLVVTANVHYISTPLLFFQEASRWSWTCLLHSFQVLRCKKWCDLWGHLV